MISFPLSFANRNITAKYGLSPIIVLIFYIFYKYLQVDFKMKKL